MNPGWETLQKTNKEFNDRLLVKVSPDAMITLTYNNGNFKQVDNFGNYEEHKEKLDVSRIRGQDDLRKSRPTSRLSTS